MAYTIGIDLGTTNMKALALSEEGKVLFELSQPAETIVVPTGGKLDPKQLSKDLLTMLREVIAAVQCRTAEPLLAICLTGMAEAGCLVNPGGDPVTPILLWYDQRGAAEAEELRPKYEAALTSVSGIRMSNVATIYKLAYLKKQMPIHSGTDLRWFGVPEWAAWILTGEHFTDPTLAVRTGAYSLKTNAWSPEVLRILDLDHGLFPDIHPISEQRNHISAFAANTLGIPEEVRVIVAGHDDMAAAYGAGLGSGTWVDSTGTAEGIVAPVSSCPDPALTVPNRMSIAPAYQTNTWALIAGVGTSGSLLAELQRQTGLSYEEIDVLSQEETAFPENAVDTELTPQRAAKVRFLPELTKEQMVAAVYDRILSSFRERVRQLKLFTDAPQQLVITGGHAGLKELNRRKSAILGNVPVIPRPHPEAAAYGAAKLGLAVLQYQ